MARPTALRPVRIDRSNMDRLRSRPVMSSQAIPARRPDAISRPTPPPVTAPTLPGTPKMIANPKVRRTQTGKTLPALAVAAVVSTGPSLPQAAHVARMARHTPIDMDLPGEASPSRLGAFFAHTKWQRVRHFAFRGVAVAIVLVITMGGLLFSQSYLKMNKVFRGGSETAAALKPNVKPELLKGEGSGRVNILLLGRGGGTHDAPDLTDTIMVASIDPVNHTSTLISLPRDLWINLPNNGVMKLNAAWQSGEFKYLGKVAPGSTDPKAVAAGFETIDQAVEEVLGIDINYNVLINFQAFQQAIDTVGGVDVNVPADLVDPTMAWENKNNPVLAKAGPQTFDGAEALRYSRSRETSSDFARGQRQRDLLVALKSKVVSLGTLSNPVKISGLINSFGNNVQTDLSIKNAQRLYSITKNIKDADTTSVGLTDGTNQFVTTGNINGQSVVLPKAGLFKYGDIRQYIRAQLKDPFIVKEKAKVLVLNGTLLPDLATNKSNELKSYGYNVIGAGNTPSGGWKGMTLVDLSKGKNKYTKHYLEKRLGVKATTTMPDNTIQTNGAKFVIIIGTNEATPTQNQAH
ncbi:MAG TPA: LCP family protein [Candidatus Saccharimonadales bacterium]|nr:LCP family protein [Candidatus Saccharimonadales bacterium]